jgi:hypothetical protein
MTLFNILALSKSYDGREHTLEFVITSPTSDAAKEKFKQEYPELSILLVSSLGDNFPHLIRGV